MLAEMIETLKTKLVETHAFGTVMDYFFDIAEDPRFLEAGQRVQNEMLESIVTMIGKQIFGRSVRLSHVLFCRIKGHHLIHGGFLLNGVPGNLFYFEDIDVGLTAVLVPGSATRVARFSSEMRGPGGNGHGNGNGRDDGFGSDDSRPMTPQEKRQLRKRLKNRLDRARKRKKKK
jgi:hypothetical protein